MGTMTRITDIRAHIMEHEDLHHWHVQWPPSWKLCVAVQVMGRAYCGGRTTTK